jgi:carbamoyltransferase
MKKNKVILWINSLLDWPHHDNWAFLFCGEEYIWINSERLDRQKYSSWYKCKFWEKWNKFLYNFDRCQACINYCLDYFWLKYEDIDLLVYLEWTPDYILDKFSWVQKIIWIYNHHLLHACSTYFASSFDDSAILVMDWQWKEIKDWKDTMTIQSIFKWEWNKIKLLKKTQWEDKRRIWIWTMYDMVTKLLWLSSEWTTMWLSSYSDKENAFWFDLLNNESWDVYSSDHLIEWLEGNILKYLNKDIFLKQLNIKESDLESSKIPYWFSADISSQLQYETEKQIIELANIAYNLTKSKNLCISWWVWLNSVANSIIVENTPFENVFIIPSTDDSWLALWAALYWKHIYFNEKSIITNFYFWKNYSDIEIKDSIKKYKKYFNNISEFSKIEVETAKLLSEWKIIWWFQLRSESWPRALWNRSIIADPRSIEIRDRVNEIKKRQWWRPLAPSILNEQAWKYFNLKTNTSDYKYMLKVVSAKNISKNKIPWVVHIDNTARIQTVFKEDNNIYYNLIKEFYKLTDIPVLLNTSFNSAWEPIVETPEDSIKMFLSSELDYLVLWNFIISKNKIYNEFSFKQWIELNSILFKNWQNEIKLYEKFLNDFSNYKKENNHIVIK